MRSPKPVGDPMDPIAVYQRPAITKQDIADSESYIGDYLGEDESLRALGFTQIAIDTAVGAFESQVADRGAPPPVVEAMGNAFKAGFNVAAATVIAKGERE